MQKQIRLLVIAPSLEMLGGQSRQCARLLERLRAEPELIVSFVASNASAPGIFRHLQQVKFVRTLLTAMVFWWRILLAIPRNDVVHVFSAAYYAYFLFGMPPVLIARAFGKKVILNYRSGEAEDHLTRWRTAVPSMRLASAIVVPSGYLVEVFRRFGLSAADIYNIIELDRFHFRLRSPLRPVFLTTRLLEPLYNVPCVLRAFGKIQQVYPDASLTVGGDGYLRPELEQMAQDLHLHNVRFIGRIPFDRMPEIYDSSDIYLTATNLDNMPSSITECLAAGLPVVTTNAGGIPYIVKNEETCLMVELDDDEAMAKAALRLLGDLQLAISIARNGRDASKQWTWQAVGTRWLRLYNELAVRS